ncbi:hypothetical protein [Labrys miyagiensis]|uniref:hypothetical protein n=1 Tax=Labrys miyagiensis TaxID=346912 RepID=UPI0024E11207|nr:hypothetical protein [Labrys miyagiensis]
MKRQLIVIDAAPIFIGLVLAQVSPGPTMMAVASAFLGSTLPLGLTAHLAGRD